MHDAALEPDRWPGVLARISDRFDGAAVLLSPERMDRFGKGRPWVHNYDPEVYHSAPEDVFARVRDVTLREMLKAPSTEPLDRRHVIADADLARDPVGRHFLRGAGVHHMVLSNVQRIGDTSHVLFLARARGEPQFDPAQFAMLKELVPHLGNAMRVHHLFGGLRSQIATFTAVLDRMDKGVVLVDESLRIDYANPAAEQLMEAGDGLQRRDGRLRLASDRMQAALDRAARHICGWFDAHAGATIDVPRPSGAAALRLTAAPAIGDATSAIAPAAQMAIFIQDPDAARRRLTPRRLMAELDLTAAEARVAALAVRALAPAEIAEDLGHFHQYGEDPPQGRLREPRGAFAGRPGAASDVAVRLNSFLSRVARGRCPPRRWAGESTTIRRIVEIGR